MIAIPHGPGPADDLGGRTPGQSVIAELLTRQAQAPPRGFLARMVGISPLTGDTSAWFKGALGEIAVARLLAKLGPEFLVLHAIPVGVGSSDIDHLVICPAGVFTLNTKNHSGQKVWVAGGTVMVNGTKHPHIRNAAFEARRACRILSRAVGTPVAVTGLVVVVNPRTFTVKQKPAGVEILESRTLQRWFMRRPRILAPDQIAQIVAQARQPSTWHSDPRTDGDPEVLNDQFQLLHQTVGSALLRRGLWVLALPATLFVAGALHYEALIRNAGG
ncbi:nuclease-related domain-containing protein [Specibacter sp. RAF43]|uniref:nuclease-related domain-containing protein n=1 Tax=Specibacter sp. RAF43 TaxID=3233057 RepID=UPI003F954134